MKNLLYPCLAFAAFGLVTPHPASAQDRIGANQFAITVRQVDRHPASPQAARRTLARIETAALAVCGASPFSLREVKASVRRSACWRGSVAGAVARIGDPVLTRAYEDAR